MDPALIRRLGSTRLALPRLGFGGAPLGGLYQAVADEAAMGALQTAWSEGVRYFDTSPWYGRGLSEMRIGAFLEGRPRDTFVLSTKVGRWLRPATGAADETFWVGAPANDIVFDYSRDGILRSYEQSLRRLRTDRLDILFIHDLDEKHFPDPTERAAHFGTLRSSGWRGLVELRESGAVGAVGVGVNQLGVIPVFAEALPLDVFLVAMPYTLLDQRALDEEFAIVERMGAGVIVGAPFASGILASDEIDRATYDYEPAAPETRERVRRLAAIASEFGVSLRGLALQFPLGHPLVASVIPGLRSAAEVTAALAAFRETVPAALWARLRADGLIRGDAPVPGPDGAVVG